MFTQKITLMTFCAVAVCCCFTCADRKSEDDANREYFSYQEAHRPQFHFSPDSMWMNDPNGMVYHNGEYHLFYQYYPDSIVWGPMHWGHAVSTDLMQWEHLPVALYPDDLGYIFSGSAVFDKANTSGLGTEDSPPLVAIFTYHDPVGEREGKTDYQTQGIAFSVDSGRSWTKYDHNPVLPNPGIKDFRDPKVIWHEASQQWIMVLAVADHVSFYSSPNLIEWTFVSDFGKEVGAHGGVWECPDLFQLPVNDSGDSSQWVLLLSINPGGINGGSATQYFVGDFDGNRFVPSDTTTRWLDYGMDNYAGVTFSNVEGRRILMGWMSNWMYAQEVPTERWRSAMTLPRELVLETVNGKIYLRSTPVKEVKSIMRKAKTFKKEQLEAGLSLRNDLKFEDPTFMVEFVALADSDWKIIVENGREEKVVVGYAKERNSYFVDRSHSGITDFNAGFGKIHYGPRISRSDTAKIKIFFDVASLELFADDGLTVMTDIYFPGEPYQQVSFENIENVSIASVKSIW